MRARGAAAERAIRQHGQFRGRRRARRCQRSCARHARHGLRARRLAMSAPRSAIRPPPRTGWCPGGGARGHRHHGRVLPRFGRDRGYRDSEGRFRRRLRRGGGSGLKEARCRIAALRLGGGHPCLTGDTGMSRSTLPTALCAVPDPMLRIAPDGPDRRSEYRRRGAARQWIRGRSFITVLRQPALISQIEAAFRDAKPPARRASRSDQAGETIYRVQVTPLSAGEDGVLLHFADTSHLHEAEEMRRDFVANVSHELRSPLTALMGFIETLRGPARDDAEARDRFLSIMEDQALRMNRLVRRSVVAQPGRGGGADAPLAGCRSARPSGRGDRGAGPDRARAGQPREHRGRAGRLLACAAIRPVDAGLHEPDRERAEIRWGWQAGDAAPVGRARARARCAVRWCRSR